MNTVNRLSPGVERTADGTQTLIHPVFGEAYHSLRGAVGESMHVFIGAGLEAALAAHRREAGPLRVLEIGFGSGLNAWLTARRAREAGHVVDYTAVELYPVAEQIWSALDYAADLLFAQMHRAPWDTGVALSGDFTLRKIYGDLAGTDFDITFDLIYMDAFAPDTQQELWSREVFRKLWVATAPGGILVTYCAKGDVRRAMQAAGYTVDRLAGALGKRHMLRAVK